MKLVIGICGASGVIYGVRLVKVLKEFNNEVYVIVTKSGLRVLKLECSSNTIEELRRISNGFYNEDDWLSPLASSSWLFDAMVVAPCTLKTLAAISYGFANNLLVRVAINALRMGKKLILVIRETPWSVIDLENALRAARAGAIILPACPAFYHEPKTIDDMVNFIVGKVLDVLGIKHNLYKRWKGYP